MMKSPVGRAIDTRLQGISNIISPRGLDSYYSATAKAKDFAVDRPPPSYPRPPGALPDPELFKKTCTSCGDCNIACPHGAIFRITIESGPMLDTNRNACYLCKDFPCIEACEVKALLPLPENALPKFGQAHLNTGACKNIRPGFSAPLSEKTITVEKTKKKSKKAKTESCRECEAACPVPEVIEYPDDLPVFADHCTGCGLCVTACPVNPSAIRISW